MTRRDLLKLTGAASVATLPVPGLSAQTNPQPRQAIVILEESTRYDMLNCNVNTGLRTPNLDRLAAQGVRYERAYNCQPVCAPARSALWTGLTPHSSGVWGNCMPLGDTTHTIGQRLTDKGIHCAFIGKWHLSGTDYFDTGFPLQDGAGTTGTTCAITSRSFLRPTARALGTPTPAKILPGRRSIAMATAAQIAPWIFSRSTGMKTSF